MLTYDQKKAIVGNARKAVRRVLKLKFPEIDEHGACLYFAFASISAAQNAGIRLVLQAGTCYWPRVTEKTDDGTEPNVFGYAWDPDGPNSRMARKLDLMPEMHVWAGDPVTQEIVDLSTGSFPVQCRKMLNIGWKAPLPPDFVWAQGKTLPPLTTYQPIEEATFLALDLFKRSMEA